MRRGPGGVGRSDRATRRHDGAHGCARGVCDSAGRPPGVSGGQQRRRGGRNDSSRELPQDLLQGCQDTLCAGERRSGLRTRCAVPAGALSLTRTVRASDVSFFCAWFVLPPTKPLGYCARSGSGLGWAGKTSILASKWADLLEMSKRTTSHSIATSPPMFGLARRTSGTAANTGDSSNSVTPKPRRWTTSVARKASRPFLRPGPVHTVPVQLGAGPTSS